MSKTRKSYEGRDLTIQYDLRRCIHAEECVRGLPGVFDPDRRPWINPDGAPVAEIRRVVELCPTGALHYRSRDGEGEELPPEKNSVRPAPDGPLYVRGDLEIHLPEGDTMRETRAALCRCGSSGNKPFCDGSHKEAGFADGGSFEENRLNTDESALGPALTLTPRKNGPILLQGPLEIRAAGGERVEGTGGALCRCGSSGNKPFCDGSHRDVGFQAL